MIERRSARLGPGERAANLDRLDDESFDLVVIGGGITGAGSALDAVSRGRSVALLEQRDLAAGTSSRSSKLIHGGLRYLEQLELGLVREALRERGLLLTKLAPHLVRPVSFVYPLRHHIWERAYVGTGVLLYATLARSSGSTLPGHRHLTKRTTLELFPGLRPDVFVGGIRYWDAQVDDARYALAVARTAAALGAVVLTSTRVTGFDRVSGRVAAVDADCLETGRRLRVEARAVVNATGVWTDEVERLAGESSGDVAASKGIHLVVARDRIASSTGIIVRTEKSVLFVIPWGDFWLIGTTDTSWRLGLAHPAASRTDIEYLLGHVNELLADPLDESDVVGVYAGLRPLLRGESDSTSKLSREHAVVEQVPGLFTVAGGKYTTYRVMARDAVDAALGPGAPASRTADIPIHGAAGYHEAWTARHAAAEAAGIDPHWVEHLLSRHGSETSEIMEAIADRRQLGAPVPGAPGYLTAEIRHAVTHEAALHLDDVLTRRTRISIETPDRGVAAAPAVTELMAEVLGWDEATKARELEHYLARVEAELESQTMPDDHTADAARLGAPDVRTGRGDL